MKAKAYPKDSDGQFMDLRDYFAAKIMQGFMQASGSLDGDEEFSFEWAVANGVNGETELGDGQREIKYTWAQYYAEEAYIVADAMMQARVQDEQT